MHLNVYIVIIFMQASLLVYALQLKSFITLDCKCDTVVLYKKIYKMRTLKSISLNYQIFAWLLGTYLH